MYLSVTYSDFETHSKLSGGAKRANYSLFLQDFCDLIEVPCPIGQSGQAATRFGKLRPATVQPLLDMLLALALMRQTENGAYVS